MQHNVKSWANAKASMTGAFRDPLLKMLLLAGVACGSELDFSTDEHFH